MFVVKSCLKLTTIRCYNVVNTFSFIYFTALSVYCLWVTVMCGTFNSFGWAKSYKDDEFKQVRGLAHTGTLLYHKIRNINGTEFDHKQLKFEWRCNVWSLLSVKGLASIKSRVLHMTPDINYILNNMVLTFYSTGILHIFVHVVLVSEIRG